MSEALPLLGCRVGVTAARKAEEQAGLLERRGATVVRAPVLSVAPYRLDEEALRAVTEEVLARPVDLFLCTTGVGVRAWFDAADGWGLGDRLVAALAGAEVLARGSKSVGALRRRGLRETWAPESERFDDVVDHLAGRPLAGTRVVVQEHGQSLSTAADALRRRGADVTVVTVYRVEPAEDRAALGRLVDLVADRGLDAVTFTSAAAATALLEAAGPTGRRAELVEALASDVLAACVGPVTAAALEPWGITTVHPDRSRLAAMVNQLEAELVRRRGASRRPPP